MKTLSTGKLHDDSKPLYLDVDDVILNTRDLVAQMLHERKCREDSTYQARFGEKPFKPERSWGFQTTYRGLKKSEILDMLDSDEFWNRVTFKQDMIALLNKPEIRENYNYVFVTKGTETNIAKKFEKMKEKFNFDICSFYAIDEDESKSVVDMSTGIMIDDNYDFLKETNAKIRLLYRESIGTDANGYWRLKDNLENLYVCEFIDEIEDILKFNLMSELVDFEL